MTRVGPDLATMFEQEFLRGEKAVTAAMADAAAALKTDWRGQTAGAGLGQRLANALRSDAWPKGTPSMDAASMVWSKAPKLTASHDTGPTIVATAGRHWLAIPLVGAGIRPGARRVTPAEWQFSRGIRLRFVPLANGNAILVADDVRMGGKGAVRRRPGRRKVPLSYQSTAVPVFLLVRQVKLPKRTDLLPAAERIGAGLPARILANWPDT